MIKYRGWCTVDNHREWQGGYDLKWLGEWDIWKVWSRCVMQRCILTMFWVGLLRRRSICTAMSSRNAKSVRKSKSPCLRICWWCRVLKYAEMLYFHIKNLERMEEIFDAITPQIYYQSSQDGSFPICVYWRSHSRVQRWPKPILLLRRMGFTNWSLRGWYSVSRERVVEGPEARKMREKEAIVWKVNCFNSGFGNV